MLESYSKGRTMMIMTEKRLKLLKNKKKNNKKEENFIDYDQQAYDM